MTIDELQAMIDDYTSGNGSKRLLHKNMVLVAQQLLELVKARPGAKTDYTAGYLEMMIRDYESYSENSDRWSQSDIEVEAANVLDNNIFWIAKELMELMKMGPDAVLTPEQLLRVESNKEGIAAYNARIAKNGIFGSNKRRY